MVLTPNFSLAELTVTNKQIANVPTPQVLSNLVTLANGLEKVRKILGNKAIKINSGYRSPEVNKAVGGATNSDHLYGFAADLVCPEFGTPLDICKAIEKSDLDFGQMIYEGTWVHISFNTNKHREILTAVRVSGKPSYVKGIKA